MEEYFLATITDIVNKWNVASDLRTGSVTSFCEQMMNVIDLSYEATYSPFTHLSSFILFYFIRLPFFVFPLWINTNAWFRRWILECDAV
jgi:hypothetical protein